MRIPTSGREDLSPVGRRNLAPRPVAVRPDGLQGAGLRYSDASLASTTGPVFNADDLPEGQVRYHTAARLAAGPRGAALPMRLSTSWRACDPSVRFAPLGPASPNPRPPLP